LVERGLTANKGSEKSNGNIDKKYFIGYLKKNIYIYIYQSSPLHIFFFFFQKQITKALSSPKKNPTTTNSTNPISLH
jgi:hypothetical protein